jgi:hypothetical protein
MKKKSKRRPARREPEKRLEDLQRNMPFEVTDRPYLRQPYQAISASKDYTVETFTTYGAYQDPI